VERANDTAFGLGASVWTGDTARGVSIGRQLDVGMVWINDVNVAFAEAPWGGVKNSGQAFELSADCLREYVFRKHVSVEKSKDARRAWWYPYGG
jgi:acyl-CoA reductase-like NAD-dependent aldehyde dehydrogenase